MANTRKYNPDVHPAAALELCRAGYTNGELAKRLHLSTRTITRWRKIYPEFDAAIELGKLTADDQVEAALFKNALGYDFDETEVINARIKTRTTKPDGTVVEVEEIRPVRTIERRKHAVPNVTAQIFWLKNRKRREWGDRAGDLDPEEQTKLDNLLQKLEGEASAELLQPEAG